MASDFMKFVNFVRPFSKKEKGYVSELDKYLESKDLKRMRNLLKNKKIGVSFSSLGVSEQIGDDVSFPQLNLALEDNELQLFVRSSSFAAFCNRPSSYTAFR